MKASGPLLASFAQGRGALERLDANHLRVGLGTPAELVTNEPGRRDPGHHEPSRAERRLNRVAWNGEERQAAERSRHQADRHGA